MLKPANSYPTLKEPEPTGEVPSAVKIRYEESLAASILHDSDTFPAIRELVGLEDFNGGTPRAIYEAASAVYARGETVTAASVGEALARANKLNSCQASLPEPYGSGQGEQAISLLEHYGPHQREPLYLARKVHELANEQRARLARHVAAARIQLGHDPKEVADELDATLARVGVEPCDVWATPVERAKRIGEARVRLATGFPTLDEATRGGLPLGSLFVFGGAPGAGKTTFAVQLAFDFAQRGAWVGLLAADEDAAGLLVRWGQLGELRRDRLEDGDEDERERLARIVDRRLVLVDGDQATVEELSTALRRKRGECPSVLIIDSLQTARISAPEAPSRREHIDQVMDALKRASRVDGHLVLATSELARAAYRSKRDEENIQPGAAYKESGRIEYAATGTLNFRSVPDEPSLVNVDMPKNRLGSKESFRLRLDSRRARFEEVEGEKAAEPSEMRRFSMLEDAIVRVCGERSGLASKRAVQRALTDARVKFRKVDADEAIDALLAAGRLVRVGEAFRPRPMSPFAREES